MVVDLGVGLLHTIYLVPASSTIFFPPDESGQVADQDDHGDLRPAAISAATTPTPHQ
jgi:hypothetical protein